MEQTIYAHDQLPNHLQIAVTMYILHVHLGQTTYLKEHCLSALCTRLIINPFPHLYNHVSCMVRQSNSRFFPQQILANIFIKIIHIRDWF